jgi:hypothetical protein
LLGDLKNQPHHQQIEWFCPLFFEPQTIEGIIIWRSGKKISANSYAIVEFSILAVQKNWKVALNFMD